MDEQRAPNLEEMDEQQAYHFLTELMTKQSAQEDYEMRHQDYTLEIPQSGERIQGRNEMQEFQAAEYQAAYPNPPRMQLRRVLVRDGLWVIEWINDYGDGRVYDVVAIVELRDGRMFRESRYYAEPFEAPEWRARWVERMDA
jgi:hypothetical protein